MNPRSVSIIVSTYRRPDVLKETLDALKRVEVGPGSEVIIVDNDATTDHAQLLGDDLRRAMPIPVHVVMQKNGGVAAARNAGARAAIGNVLFFLDDDIVVQPDTITRHLRRLEEAKPCVVSGKWVFSPQMVRALEETAFGRFRLGVESWHRAECAFEEIAPNAFEFGGVPACNLSIFRDDFWRIGGFDEAFPYASSEDLDFSLRAKQLGFRLLHDFDVVVWHNDRRLSFREYCQRQRQRLSGTWLLATKYPDFDWVRPTIAENGPITAGDSPFRIAKKILKKILSKPAPLALLHRLISVLESIWPRSPLLPKLYWSICGLHIYAGVQQGVAQRRAIPMAQPVATES